MSKFAKLTISGLTVAGLAGGAFYLSKSGTQGRGDSPLALAHSTPGQAFFWAAAELRQEASAEMLAGHLEQACQKHPKVRSFCEEIEKETGKKPRDLLKIYAASGYLALYCPPGQEHLALQRGQSPLDALFDCELNDPKAAAELLEKIKARSQQEKLAGLEVYVAREGLVLCICDKSLLIASNKAMMERAIAATQKHQATLSEDAQFKLATQKVPELTKSNGTLAYFDLRPIWKTLQSAPQASRYTDSETFASLNSLNYAIGGTSKMAGQWQSQAFLSVSSQPQSNLAKAFLKEPIKSENLAALVPDNWGSFASLDGFYGYEAVLAIIRLFPMGRMGINIAQSRAQLGPDGALEKQIRGAFTGQIAWSFDLASMPGSGRPRAAFLLGLKDRAAAEELFQQAGSSQAESMAGQKVFRLQRTSQEIYWTVASKPPTLVLATDKEAVTAVAEVISGSKTALSKNSAFQRFTKQHSDRSISLGFINLKLLLETIGQQAALQNPQSGEQAKQALGMLGQWAEHDMTCVQVESDGLRLRNEGTSGLLGLAGAGLIPILGTNFQKARGRGQLTACKSNEKNIATALEMYASDNGGRYPASLAPLTPNYLRRIPTCPAAREDTYTQTYQVQAQPDLYTFYCQGHHHSESSENFPQYSAMQGLIERP